MPLVRKADAPVFNLHGITVVGLASPKRGATETCVWRLTVPASSPGVPHAVTREEIFVGLSGRATVTIDGQEHVLGAGDAIIVPKDTLFSLANASSEPFEAMVTFPVGGKAVLDGSELTPPWTE
jgi:mannose-6-phosphate isomerase-like protein (cupin superfamily)